MSEYASASAATPGIMPEGPPGMTAGSIAGYVSPNGPIGMAGYKEKKNPVAEATDLQQSLEARRALGRTLMQGTDAMIAAGEAYAPRHPAETENSYKIRLNATTLFGGFSQSVAKQASKLFLKPVTLVDAPQPILDFANDVDGQGNTLTAFAHDLTKEAFVDGVDYLLVDFPQVALGATQADQIVSGAKPYWVKICAGAVLGWKSAAIAGEHVVTQFRFMEEVEEEVSEFEVDCITQIRVLDRGGATGLDGAPVPGSWRVYRLVKDKDGKTDWALVDGGFASWVEIPVVPLYVNRTGFFQGTPPLREMAELNKEHWMSSSEQRRALSFLRFAMLVIVGGVSKEGDDPVEIGPDKILNVPEGGDAHYVESTGAGIEAGRLDLEAIERRMQSVGMELRVENAGAVTATAAAIDSTESNAVLKAVAKGVEASLQEALRIAGTFLSIDKVGTVHVYDEFAEDVQGTPADVAALYVDGITSRETTWDELVRRHVLDDDFDPKEEKKRLAKEQEAQPSILQGSPLDLGKPGGLAGLAGALS